MSRYFAKPTGNDANDGTTWALAKATPQAVLNLCDTAGDEAVFSPGVYKGASDLALPASGSAGVHTKVIGDYTSSLADGGDNYCGVSPGYVKFDGTTQTEGTKGFDATNVIFNGNNTQAYVDWKGLWLTGGAGGIHLNPSSGNPNTDANLIEDCILEGFTYAALFISGAWTTDPGANGSIQVNRCVVIGHNAYNATPRYNHALMRNGPRSVSTPTTPFVVYSRCLFLAVTPVGIDGNSTYKSLDRFESCSFICWGHDAGGTAGFGILGNAQSYLNVETPDCYFFAPNGAVSGVTHGSHPRCRIHKKTGVNTGDINIVETDELPLLPPMAYLFPGSPLIGSSGAYGNFPDLFGTAAAEGDADCGCQEYVSGSYPIEPTLALPTEAGSGGGAVVLGNSVVR